jgi:hypothetical protein
MTQAVTLAQAGNQNGTFRNKIINGAMMISQRNGTSATSQVNGGYNLDRFGCFSYAGGAVTSKFTVTQSTSAPAGFVNSALITASASNSPAATDIFAFWQIIEGYNIADLAWGTASGKPVTLSFWVQSSVTGTFGGNIRNQNGDRSYPFTYAISSANTWTQVIINIPAPPAGSTWQTDNSQGIYVFFGLQVGSNSTLSATGAWQSSGGYSASGCVNLLATSGNTWNITGVQFEMGTVPTSFELRSYGMELALCQRYYGIGTWPPSYNGGSTQADYVSSFVQFKSTMRAVPTMSGGTNIYVDGASYTGYTVPQSYLTPGTYTASAEL